MTQNTNLNTGTIPTWCPGCFNFNILAAFKKIIQEQIDKGKTKGDFAIVTGIGCHAKMFDYVKLNGINTLHGRVPPTCFGIKLGNPNLNVFGFSGDGDAYSEGLEHTIHAARYNSDFKYIVHNNQVFALTVGQSTPTTEQGYKDKTNPLGVKTLPINPIRLMLAAGATFVARVFSDISQLEYVINEAIKHRGFAFIEVIQPCLVFHPDLNFKEHAYSLEKTHHDKNNFQKAWEKSNEFDYNGIHEKTKIPLGIFYQDPTSKNRVFEDLYPQLQELKKKKISWKDIKR
ncbi:MAG: thiamine pyrophosphate-dependent enzyme [Nanoarchaeota archaeon]